MAGETPDFYYYAPGGVPQNPRYRLGQSVVLPSGWGGPSGHVIRCPRMDGELYGATVTTDTCPAYNEPSVSLAFSGTVGDVDARVVETRVCTPWTLDELNDQKNTELEEYLILLRNKSVRSTTNNNFWIDLSDISRELLASANQFLTDRHKDRSIGQDTGATPIVVGDPATYWARDISVILIRNSNGNRLVAAVDENAWGQVLKDVGLYDLSRRDAYVACSADIDAAYQASDWSALAAIDVTSATYGWPDYYQGTPSSGFSAAVSADSWMAE